MRIRLQDNSTVDVPTSMKAKEKARFVLRMADIDENLATVKRLLKEIEGIEHENK